MRWTRRSIIAEIKRLYKLNEALNYATAEARHLNLVRAAAWHFGTWRYAVEAAGIDYEALSKYRRWSRQRIIERIRELHDAGADLSWRTVSLQLDPPLAAAALRPNGFPSWRAAVTAAGLDINAVARYQSWNRERVIREIQRLHRAGFPLSSKSVQDANQPLFCAARRRFGSWDSALDKAGLNAAKIRLRRAAGTPQSNGNSAHNARHNRSRMATLNRRTTTTAPASTATAGGRTRATSRAGGPATKTAPSPTPARRARKPNASGAHGDHANLTASRRRPSRSR